MGQISMAMADNNQSLSHPQRGEEGAAGLTAHTHSHTHCKLSQRVLSLALQYQSKECLCSQTLLPALNSNVQKRIIEQKF